LTFGFRIVRQRKALMTELSDDLIASPGGIGTLEQLFDLCGTGTARPLRNRAVRIPLPKTAPMVDFASEREPGPNRRLVFTTLLC
jgi:hypothetical protein